jgi:hypothetical protein
MVNMRAFVALTDEKPSAGSFIKVSSLSETKQDHPRDGETSGR